MRASRTIRLATWAEDIQLEKVGVSFFLLIYVGGVTWYVDLHFLSRYPVRVTVLNRLRAEFQRFESSVWLRAGLFLGQTVTR